MTVLPVSASRGECTGSDHCTLCATLSVTRVLQWSAGVIADPLDLQYTGQRSKVVNSIYSTLRRSDSHPECNLTPRCSDLHGLRVRFKSFNYCAVCWRFEFGLLILFCSQ